MSYILTLPPSSNYTPQQALEHSISLDLQDVLVVGYDQEGFLKVRSSKMTRAEVLWLLKQAELHTLDL